MTALANRPSAEQALVLHAALDQPPEALAAWERWRATIEFDEIDHGSARLLPLVYRNLGIDLLDEEVAGRLKGMYRLSWSRNQVIFKRAAAAVRALEDAGIATLVLKGASLVVLSYRDVGVRPMEDVDILVPLADAERAIEILAATGWETDDDDPVGRTRVHHSMGYVEPGGGSVDLHWFSLWQPARDVELWEAAVPMEIGGAATRAPCPADQLLLACVHGTPWSPLPPFRWIADAVTQIRVAGDDLDWDRLSAEAERRRLTVATAAALAYLAAEFDAPVPAAVLERLAAAPASRHERAAFRAACRPDSPVRTLRMAWDRYRRLRDLDTGALAPAGFLPFAQSFWGVDSPWALPARAGRAAFRRVARGGDRSAA